jgi:signal transduction histidine kinase
MHRLLQIIACLMALLPVGVAAQEQKPAIDSVEQPQALPELERVSGVVTFVAPEWRLLFVQNGEQATKVGLPESVELPEQLVVGDLVEVEGRRFEDQRFQALSAARVTRTETGGILPDAVPLDSRDAVSSQNENRIVEAEGVVYQAGTGNGYRYLQIATEHTGLQVSVGIVESTPDAPDLLGQRVRFRGVLVFPVNDGDPVKVLLPGSQLQITTSTNSAAEGPESFQPIEATIRTRRSGNESVEFSIVGQAVTDSQSPEVIVQDASGSIRVESSQLPDIQVGDIVVARGSIEKGGRRLPVLTGDVVRVGAGQPLVAERVPTNKVVNYPHQYLATAGTFTGFLAGDDEQIPILENKDTAFKVSGSDELLAKFDQLPGGTRLNLTGVARPRKGKNYEFEFLATDIDVLYLPVDSRRAGSPDNSGTPQTASVSGPPATLTAPVRTTGGLPSLSELPSEVLLIVAGVALLLMLGLLVAFLILLKRSQERRKFYATIHEQLNEVSHVSRLNTLAEMVGALAHELNQPLASVTNFAETARIMATKLDDPSPQLEKLLERVTSESLRAGEIIRRLRSLASRKTPGQVSTSLNQVVNDSLDMFRMQELVANGTVETHLEEDLPRIDVDPIQLQQVILNLLLNARDATSQLEGRFPKITVRTERSDDWLTVSVDDNGPGISSDDPSTVFEPYFTTKPEGMGLGLAICRTIVESHNGKLGAENLDPHGARLSVSLPLLAPEGLSVVSDAAA